MLSNNYSAIQKSTIQKSEFVFLDLFKFLFACTIPILHLAFRNHSILTTILQQYIARLGVPFFFCVSGFLLAIKLWNQENQRFILLHYLKHILRLYLVWMIIYLPLTIIDYTHYNNITLAILDFLKSALFLPPGFLWFLIACAFAAIPFCLISNRKLLYCCSIILYIIGVLGNSYVYIIGAESSIYYKIFLTTRNGLFFALPFFCCGELIIYLRKKFTSKIMLSMSMVSFFLLVIEISFVRTKNSILAITGIDNSMYFLLPVFITFFITYLSQITSQISFKSLRIYSTGIYVMQYGFITFWSIIFAHIGAISNFDWLKYLLVLLSCFIATNIITRCKKLSRILL